MKNKENNRLQGLYEDVVVGGSYVYPIGDGEFRTGQRSEKSEKEKEEKSEDEK